MRELYNYLNMTNEEMISTIRNIPNATCKRTIEGNNFFFMEGSKNSPLVLIAHTDTLPRKKVELVQKGVVLTNKYGLLGADDRAGVYAALEVYKKAKVKPHLLFTDMEEVGGVGAKEVANKMQCPEGVNLLIELDRKGCNEYVTYQDQQKGVHKYIKKFGFREEYGSYSDIADIGPAWNCASVNVSVGYYNQHTEKESLHLDELELTISRLLAMTEDPIEKAYPPPEDMYMGFGFCDRYRPGDWGYTIPKEKKPKTKHNLSSVVGMAHGVKVPDSIKPCEFCGDHAEKLFQLEGMWVCVKCWDWVADSGTGDPEYGDLSGQFCDECGEELTYAEVDCAPETGDGLFCEECASDETFQWVHGIK